VGQIWLPNLPSKFSLGFGNPTPPSVHPWVMLMHGSSTKEHQPYHQRACPDCKIGSPCHGFLLAAAARDAPAQRKIGD